MTSYQTQESSTVVRILIVGYGSIGKRHARILRESLPNADLRILHHRPHDKVPKLANGCFSSLDEVESFSPQAAVICNPAPFHIEIAEILSRLGCHLLVEKPLSHNTTNVRALLQAVSSHNLILQVGYNFRFLPSLVYYRELIRSSAIGRVMSVRCEVGQYLPSWRPDVDYRETVSASHDLGGGVLLELSHELDYLRWIFGEIVWVSAWLGQQSSLEINVEDTAHLILGFSRNSRGHELVATLNLDCIRHDTTRSCTAIGELGSLLWDGIAGVVYQRSNGASEWQPIFEPEYDSDHSYRSQWEHFLSCIESGQTPRVTGEDGLSVLSIVETARQSAAKKRSQLTVTYPEIDRTARC